MREQRACCTAADLCNNGFCILYRMRTGGRQLLLTGVRVVLDPTTANCSADTKSVAALSSQHELVDLIMLEKLRSSGCTEAHTIHYIDVALVAAKQVVTVYCLPCNTRHAASTA
jgi:hypothetical protein